MPILARILFCCVVTVLVGCASYDSSVKRLNERIACKTTCYQRLDECNKTCHNSCRQCTEWNNFITAKRYQHYKDQQCIKGEIIMRDLNSYRDPLQCCKTTCECPTDFRVCVKSCSGKIPKRLQAVPAC